MSTYKVVDKKKWKRKETFSFFNDMTYPYLTITSKVDITGAYNFSKRRGTSLYGAISWIILKAINQIDEFKYGIKDDSVIKFDKLGTSFSVLKKNNMLNFSRYTDFSNDFDGFLEDFDNNKQEAEKGKEIKNKELNLIYITCIPNIELSGLVNPMDLDRKDTITRICWGKVIKDNTKNYITVSVQVHHGMVDGLHIGILNQLIEEESKLLGDRHV